MASTSSEFGGLFFHREGHKLAQFYGMFFWAGVILFIATAWRVKVESNPVVSTDQLPGPDTRHQLFAPHTQRLDSLRVTRARSDI